MEAQVDRDVTSTVGLPGPVGTIEHSPRRQPWETARAKPTQAPEGRQDFRTPLVSPRTGLGIRMARCDPGLTSGATVFRPYGTRGFRGLLDPAMNRWAVLTASRRDAHGHGRLTYKAQALSRRGVAGAAMSVALVVALAGAMSGCATFRTKPSASSSPPATGNGPVPAVAPVEKEQETLAAVEEFLARTQGYRLGSSPTSPAGADSAGASGGETGTPGVAPQADHPAPPPDQAFANTQVALPEASPPKPTLAIPAVQSVAVRWADPSSTKAAEPGNSNSTNAPLDAQPADGAASVDRLLVQLRNQVAAKKDFEAEWQLRLVELAFERDAQAMDVSPHIGERARTMLTGLIQAAAAIRNAARDPLLTGEEAIARVDQLREAVTDQADPVVSAVALCRKVVTFGAYEEMPREDFVAGRSTQTIVYSEIANLRAEKTAEGLFQTRLGTRLEVLTVDGKSVWQREEPEIVDTCRRRRSDFFIAQRITLPPTLPAGDYVLKVFVDDKLSSKADEASLPFTVNSPISLAKGKP